MAAARVRPSSAPTTRHCNSRVVPTPTRGGRKKGPSPGRLQSSPYLYSLNPLRTSGRYLPCSRSGIPALNAPAPSRAGARVLRTCTSADAVADQRQYPGIGYTTTHDHTHRRNPRPYGPSWQSGCVYPYTQQTTQLHKPPLKCTDPSMYVSGGAFRKSHACFPLTASKPEW